MTRDGKVQLRREPGDGKPDRHVYRLTKAGEAEFDEWLRAPTEPLQLRHPLLLKFVFATEVEPQALDRVLPSYEQGLVSTRQEYLARRDAKEIFSFARSKREGCVPSPASTEGKPCPSAWT